MVNINTEAFNSMLQGSSITPKKITQHIGISINPRIQKHVQNSQRPEKQLTNDRINIIIKKLPSGPLQL